MIHNSTRYRAYWKTGVVIAAFFALSQGVTPTDTSIRIDQSKSPGYELTAYQIDSLLPEVINDLRKVTSLNIDDTLRRFIKKQYQVSGDRLLPRSEAPVQALEASGMNPDTLTFATAESGYRDVVKEFLRQSPEIGLILVKFRTHPPRNLSDSIQQFLTLPGKEPDRVRSNRVLVRNYQEKQYHDDSLLLSSLSSNSASYARRFLSPYHLNYIATGWVTDPGRYGDKYDGRMGLKFQLSQKMPVLTHKYTNSGLYFAMTFKALFDVALTQESSPVSKKVFMPELYGSIDLAWLRQNGYPIFYWIPIERDRNLIQIGMQHESNGGYIEESRSILYKGYLAFSHGFLPSYCIDEDKFHPKSTWLHRLNLKTYYMAGIAEENPDIYRYLGFEHPDFCVELSGEHEFPISTRIFPGILDGTLIDLTWMLNPRSEKTSLGPIKSNFLNMQFEAAWTPRWIVRNPKNESSWIQKAQVFPSLYIRYWRGFNEYLITYDKETQWFGMGIYMR